MTIAVIKEVKKQENPYHGISKKEPEEFKMCLGIFLTHSTLSIINQNQQFLPFA